MTLSAKSHDRVDNVVVVLFQSLDGLLPRNARLCHDQFDVLTLKPILVNVLPIIVVLLAVVVVMVVIVVVIVIMALSFAVVVSGVIVCAGELLSSIGLGLRVEVFDFGLAEDAAQESQWSTGQWQLSILTYRYC
jgi:hypothetical protein